MDRIAVIGAGAWGTALAAAARAAGREVGLWAHEDEVARVVNAEHENATYLPGITLDPAIVASSDPARVLAGADAVLLVPPAQHLRRVCQSLRPHWPGRAPAVICAKGIELGTCALMSEAAAEALGPDVPLAVMSGPSFAAEVARGLPAALTLAATDGDLGERLMAALTGPSLRLYVTTDMVGAQMGGAVKNVLAIACGIVEGRSLGDNARAALITRGLAEIARLAVAKGADPETLAGLSGLGDLVLTCTAMQSRNFSFGVALGQGKTVAEILGARASVTEGVYTAASVTELARRMEVDMPICLAVDGILNFGADVDAVVRGLMNRPLKHERFGT